MNWTQYAAETIVDLARAEASFYEEGDALWPCSDMKLEQVAAIIEAEYSAEAEKVMELREASKNYYGYGKHTYSCAMAGNLSEPCDCGFQEAVTRLRAALDGIEKGNGDES